jgi:hypothetical protein
MSHDRSGKEFDGGGFREGSNVRKAAHPADVDFTFIEAALALLPGDVADELGRNLEFLADVDRERPTEKFSNVGLTGCEP